MAGNHLNRLKIGTILNSKVDICPKNDLVISNSIMLLSLTDMMILDT